MTAAESVKGKFSITWADLPLVIISSICFVSYIAMGFFVGAIGAAIPEIAESLNRESTSLSIIYTARGVGFFMGTFLGSAQNEISVLKAIRTDFMVCIPTLLVGVGAFILFLAPLNLWLIMVVVCLQASMFAFLDVVGNILLMEIWDIRVEPWLQALHAFFGVGAVVGPAIVGVVKFRLSNLCLCVICVIPTAIGVVSWLLNLGSHKPREVSASTAYEVTEKDEDDHATNCSGDESAIEPTENVIDIEDSALSSPVASNKLRLTFFLFYFVYVGLETGFGGWITAFSKDTEITNSDARAAFLSSVFFFGITVGRLLSVPVAMYVTPTRMMCALFVLVWVGVGFFTAVTSMDEYATYAGLVLSSSVLGLGISSIYPVGLTISQDYDSMVMDSRSISVCCIGAVCGEAIMPMCFGLLMNAFTPDYLLYCTLVVAVVVSSLYVLIHFILVGIVAEFRIISVKEVELAEESIQYSNESINPLREEEKQQCS